MNVSVAPTGRNAEIAHAIRSARIRRKLTQDAAARSVGVSRFQWIRWEQGLHRPTAERAAALVALLGLPEELFEDEDEESRAVLAVGYAVRDLIRREREVIA